MNTRPIDLQSIALPTELSLVSLIYRSLYILICARVQFCIQNKIAAKRSSLSCLSAVFPASSSLFLEANTLQSLPPLKSHLSSYLEIISMILLFFSDKLILLYFGVCWNLFILHFRVDLLYDSTI